MQAARPPGSTLDSWIPRALSHSASLARALLAAGPEAILSGAVAAAHQHGFLPSQHLLGADHGAYRKGR